MRGSPWCSGLPLMLLLNMAKRFFILVSFAVLFFSTILFFKSGNLGTSALWGLSNEGQWLFPLVAVAALIDSINPCAFSILLLTIAFLLSIGKMRSGILKIGGAYIAGIFAVYVMIGLGLLQALHLFATPHFMAQIGASLLLALGAVNIINEFFPSFPLKLRIPETAHRRMAGLMERASVPTAFLLGGLVGLCEFPCTGGPYLMIIGLLHDQATYLTGVAYLLFYNVLFVLPLVTILALASSGALLNKVQAWKNKETKNMRF